MSQETMIQRVYENVYYLLGKGENKGRVLWLALLAYGNHLNDSTIAQLVEKAFWNELNNGLKIIYK
jgi:hypothetical protein